MASIPCPLIVLLICLSQDHMGIHGESLFVVSPAGQNVTLSCGRDPYGLCGGTWHYNDDNTVDVLVGFKERAKRLRALSNHSLLITDVTTDDAGLYTCHKTTDTQSGNVSCGFSEDTHVNFSVLNVFLEVTEMEANSSVTLHCLLHTHDKCGETVADKGVILRWVDETGGRLENTNHQWIRRVSPCHITLAEENTAPNPFVTGRTWTCQLIAGGNSKTFTYTTLGTGVHMAVRVATTASLFVSVIIVAVIHRKKSDDHQCQANTPVHSIQSAATTQSL